MSAAPLGRVIPPVRSPLSLQALGTGLAALVSGAGSAESVLSETLCRRFGSRRLIFTDSGTSALILALRATRDDGAPGPAPVALPAYGCYDLATAADGADVPVLLYDIDPETLGPEMTSLRAALERGARTVVVAHLYGVPVDLALVRAELRTPGARLVEYAAQGAGAAYVGRPLGAHGSYAVLSFGRGKGITSGQGGALLANDKQASAIIKELSSSVSAARADLSEPLAAAAQWLLARPSLYGIPSSLPFLGLGETVYRPPREPRQMSAFALGVLGRTLELADRETGMRRARAERLLAAIQRHGATIKPILAPRHSVPGWLRLPVIAADTQRSRLRSAQARRLGIMPGYPETLADLPGFRARVRNVDARFDGARHLTASLFTLPTHGALSEADLSRLERWLFGTSR